MLKGKRGRLEKLNIVIIPTERKERNSVIRGGLAELARRKKGKLCKRRRIREGKKPSPDTRTLFHPTSAKQSVLSAGEGSRKGCRAQRISKSKKARVRKKGGGS